MKKDWKQCKFNEEHWMLYKNLQFHEQCTFCLITSVDCVSNPVFRKDPIGFR
jgi:hypothetical protein